MTFVDRPLSLALDSPSTGGDGWQAGIHGQTLRVPAAAALACGVLSTASYVWSA